MELPLITVMRIHADAAMLADSYQRALAAACSNTLFFFFLCVCLLLHLGLGADAL